MSIPAIRKGQGSVKLTAGEFRRRLLERFADPAFEQARAELDRIVQIAWDGYDEYRKSPRRRTAGPGFADPEHELPIEWLDTRDRIREAEQQQKDPASPARILLVCADGGNPDPTTTHGKNPQEAKALRVRDKESLSMTSVDIRHLLAS